MLTYSKNNSINGKINKNIVIWSIVIISIFTWYNLSASSMLLILGLGTILLAMVTMKDIEFFTLIFILFPNVMQIKMQDRPDALLGYIVVLFFLKLLFTRELIVKSNVFMKLFLGVILLSVSLFLNSEDFGFLIRMISFILILIFLHPEIESKQMKVVLVKSYIFGCVLDILSAFVFYTLQGESIFVGYFAGIRDDRNYFSITCAIAIVMLVVLVVYYKTFDLFEAFSFTVLSVGGILSNSRTFFILYIFAVFLLMFVFFKSKKVFAFFIVAVLIYIIGRQTFLSDFVETFENLLLRFEEDDASGGNGRFEAWSAHLEYLFSDAKNILFGCGDSTKYLDSNLVKCDNVEHNSIIQLIFTVGIFGSIGYLFSMFSMADIVLIKPKTHRLLILYMPLLILIVGYCTINGAFSDRVIYAIYLSFCILSLPQDKENIISGGETNESCST